MIQAFCARFRLQSPLLLAGMAWLLAAGSAYLLSREPGSPMFLPQSIQFRFGQIPLEQFSQAFPTFASTIALSLLCVWALGYGKGGGALVCGGWIFLEGGFQYGQRSDVSSWIIPMLPDVFHRVWPLTLLTRFLGTGNFNFNNVASAVLGGLIAYAVVVNSTHTRRRPAPERPFKLTT